MRVASGGNGNVVGNEGETRRVVNDIIIPKSNVKITIRTEEGDVTEDAEVATTLTITLSKR